MVKTRMGTLPQFKIVKEAGIKYGSDTFVTDPASCYKILNAIIGDMATEHAAVLYLNQKHKVMGYEIVSVGTINQCFMMPREVFRGALMHGAAAIVIGHNHPSGDPTPSQDDINVTETILKAGAIVGVKVLDHIVVGEDNKFTSLREQCIQKLWLDNNFHA